MTSLVVLAHPDSEGFLATLAARATVALGPAAQMLDLYRLGFDPTMSRPEHRRYLDGRPPTDPIAVEHARALTAAKNVVFVYSNEWGTVPAMLKGWLDCVFAPDVAFTLTDRWPHVRPALTNVRTVTGIASYDASRWRVRFVGDGGRRTMTRAMRLACGWRTRTRWLPIYSLDRTTPDERAEFVRHVEERLGGLR